MSLFTISVAHLHLDLPPNLTINIPGVENLLTTIMSAIKTYADKQAAHNEKIETAVQGITDDIKVLNDKITALQNSAGEVSAEDQALLDDLEARGAAVADKLDALNALTPPVTPTE